MVRQCGCVQFVQKERWSVFLGWSDLTRIPSQCEFRVYCVHIVRLYNAMDSNFFEIPPVTHSRNNHCAALSSLIAQTPCAMSPPSCGRISVNVLVLSSLITRTPCAMSPPSCGRISVYILASSSLIARTPCAMSPPSCGRISVYILASSSLIARTPSATSPPSCGRISVRPRRDRSF